MSTEDVMSAWEYREERRDEYRPLLDHEGMPREDVPADSTALARLASVIYLNARELTPEQLENAICWLKTWKIGHTSPARREFSEFSAVLDGLRNSPEQVDLQKRARRYLLGSRVLTVVLCLCGLVFLLHLSSGNGRWYSVAVGIVLLIAVFAAGTWFDTQALLTAKEQDRKYFLSCLREAHSENELMRAGLLAYYPNPLSLPEGQSARIAMDAIHEQLSDALYRKLE